MAVENYFLSREGRVLSNRILKFMRSLIIKIITEANLEETKETYLNWIAYKYAIEGTDDIFSYDYTYEDCRMASISNEAIVEKQLLDRDKCYKLQLFEDPDVLRLLKYLRNKRIENYVEYNSYYSQFQGIPREGQEIQIINKDRSSPLEPEYVLLHKITIDEYPLTYEYVFNDGLIDKIRKENPSYYYLRFLDSNEKISIYKARNTEQFDILSYDTTILNETELNNFFKIYSNKKLYMQELMYVEGFNSRMDMYPFLMEILLLQDVFMSFFNSYMDNFALANYGDQEIFDILDSYNLSNLKKVKMSTLRKIIRNLPDLIELRGSDLIIEKILDIVADDSVTIKRYYLAKNFNTNEHGEIKIDTTKTYEENVDIVFKEKIIRQGTNKLEETENDYDEFVADDDTWGGDLEGLEKEEKNKIKQNFKRELKQLDFSSILTKYLTISSTVNSYTKQVKVQNLLGILWQYLQKNVENNFMINDVISFNSYEIRPIDLYAAICWFRQFFNNVSDPDIIRINDMNISNVIMLRDTGVEQLVNNIANGTEGIVQLPKGFGDSTVKEIIDILGHHDDSVKNTNTDDEMWPYYIDKDGEAHINYRNTLISFDPNATISELFTKYDENIKIIDALKRKWIDASTLEESKCWEYLIEQNQINVSYQILFDNEERFSTFIRKANQEFSLYLSQIINSIYEYDPNTTAYSDHYFIIYTLYVKMLETFRDYMLNISESNLSLTTPNSEENDGSVEYLNDLKLLFNEFLSIYTELHKIEYSQVIDDSPYNRIKLLYHFDNDILFNTLNDKTFLNNIIESDNVFNSYKMEMNRNNKINMIEKIKQSIDKKIDNIDELENRLLNEIEKDNILLYLDEKKEEIIHKDQSHLNDIYYNIYSLMISLLNDENVHTIDELLNIQYETMSGRDIYREFLEDEIEKIKEIIKEINERNDILPNFKTYVTQYLFEYYSDYIILNHLLSSDEVENIINNKVYLEDKIIDEFIELYKKDKIKLLDTLVETDISYTLFAKDYFENLIYQYETDELYNILNDGIYLHDLLINDEIENDTEEKIITLDLKNENNE